MKKLHTYPTYNCHIVDNDPVFVSQLSAYLQAMAIFKIAGVYLKTEQALKLLNEKNTIDFLFLGIENDDLSGFDLAVKLRNASKFIVFTSENPAYALNAFQSGGDQYLMKPLLFPKLSDTIDQLLAKDKPTHSLNFLLNQDGNFLRVPRLFK